MIQCKVQVKMNGQWLTVKKLGTFSRVEDARTAMHKLRLKTGLQTQVVSTAGTALDCTEWEFEDRI